MIRTQIEAIVNQLTAQPTFEYGTSAELNVKLDNASFPCVALYNLKPSTKKYTLSNTVDSHFSILLAFLYKTEFDQDTSDNEVYVVAADKMCDEFMVKLANFRETPYASRFFKIHENDPAKSVPVYNKMSVNSTGVTLQITLSTMNNDNIPLP